MIQEKGQYNRHFQKNMTLLELQEILLSTDPELEEIMRLKRVLTRMYESGTMTKLANSCSTILMYSSGTATSVK